MNSNSVSIWTSVKKIPLEAVIWTLALIALGLSTPDVHQWSICPLHLLGFEHCPGCGLGRSVAYLLQGELSKSWSMHPLGGFALVMLTYRIVSLIYSSFKK